MRLDTFINGDPGLIKDARYMRLRRKCKAFMVMYSPTDGWITRELDALSEAEARKWLTRHWKMARYEQANAIEPYIRFILFNVVNDPDRQTGRDPEADPPWPPDLAAYDTDCFPEAYLCHKFDIKQP